MARAKVVEGMPINTSSPPPKCEHCIVGKQTRSSVPRVREGVRANSHLARIFVDLCGPMSVRSRSGRLYSMNIIDDYSGFVWSLPLRSKDEAAPVLQNWLTFIELQTPHRLKSFVTDNGELASNQIQEWCARKGILHLLTAPYTSAQNGRAERLHRTILDKARAMLSASAAPIDLWDEFCATSAYLTNLTGATANNGRTPHELWYGKKPDLSHLREIACRAFALIPTHNPKLHHRSVPCILIGYAPNSKAYRLWDRSSNRVFNSYHVTFIESRDLPPNVPVPPNTVPSSTSPAPALVVQAIPAQPDIISVPMPNSQPRVHLQPYHYLPTNYNPLPQHLRTPPILPPTYSENSPSIPHQNPITPQPSDNITAPNTVPPQHPIAPPPPVHLSPPVSNVPQPPAASPSPVAPLNSNIISQTPAEQISPTPPRSSTPPPSLSSPLPNPPPLPNPQITVNPPSPPQQLSTPPAPLYTPPAPLFTPPAPPPLRRSPRLNAIPNDTSLLASCLLPLPGADNDHRISAFLAEYSEVRDTHTLLPISLSSASESLSVNEVLAALATGNTELALDEDDDPLWSSALDSPEREFWVAGAREELKSLKDLNVFVLVPRSEVSRDQRPLKGKLVCKRKRDDAGNIARYKVRYVAKGFAQRYRIDYNKTTAPTARLESFRALLHIAAVLDWDVQHVDIKTAFLHGVLPSSETVYMEQPPGFEETGKEDWVMRLLKSIYGMKQASRIWNKTFHKTISSIGFERLTCEWCVYRRQSSTGITMFAVHVDDIICISSSPNENTRFKDELRQHWELSDLGPVKYALGIAVVRDRASHTISLSQTALIDRVIDQFGQTDAHPVDTPMVTGLQIVRPDKTLPISDTVANWVQRTPYRSLVGTLNYLAVASRPDITFAVGRLATVLDCYRSEHWDAAIRVVRYLTGTRLFRLELGGSNSIHPLGFSDSDWANCPTTSRSVGGYCFSLGSGMVSWASHKHPITADSSCYAEYIALHDASHEVIFLRQLLEGLNLLRVDPTPLYCDSDSARCLTEDQRWHSKVRHFRVKFHSTRELVDADELSVIGIRSDDNAADIFTKSLARLQFERLRSYLGMFPPRAS
jgi:transposase InsO family protein